MSGALVTYDFGSGPDTAPHTASTEPVSLGQIDLLQVLRAAFDQSRRWPEGMKTETACEYLGNITSKTLSNIAQAHGIEKTVPGGLWPKRELDRYLGLRIEEETK